MVFLELLRYFFELVFLFFVSRILRRSYCKTSTAASAYRSLEVYVFGPSVFSSSSSVGFGLRYRYRHIFSSSTTSATAMHKYVLTGPTHINSHVLSHRRRCRRTKNGPYVEQSFRARTAQACSLLSSVPQFFFISSATGYFY